MSPATIPPQHRERARKAVITSTIPLTLATFHNELIRQVQQAGYEVTVVSSPGPELKALEEAHGIATVAIPMAREIDPANDVVALRRWIDICRRVRPHLVVAATPKASLLAMVAARATGVPLRLYYVGGLRLEGEHGFRRQLLTAMERATGRAATHVVMNSPSLIARALDLSLYRPKTLFSTTPGSSHGVDASHFSPRQRDTTLRSALGLDDTMPTIGFVGRLTKDKGIDSLLAALRILHQRGIAAQLLVVGAQTEPDSQRYADALSQEGSVVFAGRQDDVRPYYALMDVHVLPSLREGFPNVVLESAAMGVPTVTTDATGCVDSVVPGVTGIIVPVLDPGAMAQAIADLLADPDRRSRMGAAARERAKHDYVPEAVVSSLLAPVIAGPSPHPRRAIRPHQ